jgi:hypothetical protein
METHSQYLRLVWANVSDEVDIVMSLLLGQKYANQNITSTRKSMQCSRTRQKAGRRI